MPLTSLDYRIVGTELRVTPAVLAVPKGVAGSVFVQFTAGSATNFNPGGLASNAVVEATLRGPSFPARKLVGRVNEPLLLPPLPLVGDYELNDIKLVDAATGATRFEATPNRVPVQVFDEVLVSRVTSRPLTLAEIQDRGIVIDQQNFRAVEFEVGFVLDGQTIPVRFPVVAPTFQQSTEIIPRAELEARLAEANRINNEIGSTVTLPEELEGSRVNIFIQGVAFQPVEEVEQDLALRIPPIPALVVIPGNIGFLNQFFSVQIFTENAAPRNSGLSVVNVSAAMTLPPGPDRIASTNYNEPGDDPLRFARVGPNAIIQPVQPVVQPGADGRIGTPDDIGRLQPGESGQGEFLVEGLQEGLHVMDITLAADLEGLAAGPVRIQGKAAGSVLVKNPRFSLSFSHPRTVRTGEPYDAFVTILNTSSSVANLVNVTLRQNSISGGVLESAELVELGTILPGQSATARYRIRSQRTGAISFSNLTTSDDSVQGRFNLSMGIDERGVPLSPDTIAMPDYVNALPPAVIAAANRVLGQALSVATAPQLPPNIQKVTRSFITRRVLELAEAGQRVQYGDSLPRVLADLLLDWQGGRQRNGGFDQILRETDAGREWREALMREMEAADALTAGARLAARAPDFAGRSEAWLVAASDTGGVELLTADNRADAERSGIPYALGYSGTNGQWLAALGGSNQLFRFRFPGAPASGDAALLLLGTNGAGRLLRWNIPNPPADACFTFDPASAGDSLVADLNCDGFPDGFVSGTSSNVVEMPPAIIAVLQDTNVVVGRPPVPCSTMPFTPRNYGTVLAVLFSKPMTQERVNVPSAYSLDNGNTANSVQIQPGGRVVLLNMRLPVSALKPRTMTVANVTDLRGNPILAATNVVQTALRSGVSIKGRVARADGGPAAGIPVTLTMYDQQLTGFDCNSWVVRVCQVLTDPAGRFEFDYVMSGIPYTISATDTSGLSPDAAALIAEAATPEGVSSQQLNELARLVAELAQSLGLSTAPAAEAIAAAEGVDRALLRDLVSPGSAREQTEVPVALRFRGRASVAGTVLAADGVTPLAGVAVNLFPDPDSRELGRGVFSDANGRFAFAGVPLGVFTIGATNSAGLTRVVSDIIETPGEVRDVVVILSGSAAEQTALAGRVLEADGVTPHPGATVFVGQFQENLGFCCVVAVATADADGFWRATGVPVGSHDLVAISFDGRRKGERRDILAVSGVAAQANITLQNRAIVRGRVETSTGVPVPGALVGGGEGLVRTDASGQFLLEGVPTGQRTISAGIERNPALGFDFPRLGSAQLNVLAGVDNFVIVRLQAAGRVIGRVLDELGRPVPNVVVAKPEDNGFSYVTADAGGNYAFENLPLAEHTFSAPAPATANTDVSGLLQTLRSDPTEEQIKAAIGEAFAIFFGANDPFLNGSGLSFTPGNWGFVKTRLTFDGQTAVADIRYIPRGTIAGRVLNGQGVPIGAAVRLTGIGPKNNGDVGFQIRGDVNSDPATGEFSFPNAAFIGSFGLQAASPFFPTVISLAGFTTSINPNATNLILQFPAAREVNGRLAGRVFNPDGSPAGGGVKVAISFGSDYVITTDTNGFFDTQIGLPALGEGGQSGVGYTLIASNLAAGLVGRATAIVLPGITNLVNVTLLGKGALDVLVTLNDGSPATNASVEIRGISFPNEQFTGFTGPDGVLRLGNLTEGAYAVAAALATGPTVVSGRTSAGVARDQTNTVTVRLSPTATIRGVFVKADGVTPVTTAQVSVGSLGFAVTDTNGVFEIAGVPLGSYRVSARDPVSGRGGFVDVTLSFNGEVRQVRLVEQPLVLLTGAVLNGFGTGFVPGAEVTLRVNDGGFTPERTVTTGPDGRFSFPATPPGSVSLTARDPITGDLGSASTTIPDTATTVDVTVPLQPLANLEVIALLPDGVTPATNTTLTLTGGAPGGLSADTDTNGRVRFERLTLGNYSVVARELTPGRTRSVGATNGALTASGEAPAATVRLRGVGTVTGRVFLGDGITPAANAEVELTSQAPLVLLPTETRFTDAQGDFAFSNVAVGPYRVVARAQALAGGVNGQLAADGVNDSVTITLGASGSVLGVLTRADGVTPVAGAELLLTFPSQSGLPGRAFVRSAADGSFRFDNVPVGTNQLETAVAQFGGLARVRSVLSTNGQILDLGVVALDEADPRVVQVTPADTTAGVPINTVVELLFSEALDTNTVNTNGVFVRRLDSTNALPAAVQVLPDPTNGLPRLVRLTPLSPLLSERTYEVVVVNGERLGPLGELIATGPLDLVGRPLPAPFISHFTTADNDPPVLLSIFPSNNAVQIDPRSVPRLAFNEPLRSNAAVTLTGPAGFVAGTVAFGLNNTIVTFTPDAALAVNASYTLTVSNVTDLAGNAAQNQPFVATFATLDTLGPELATVQIADGRQPVAGATIPIEASLVVSEPGVAVRFTQDFNPVGVRTNPPFRVNVALPASGTTTIRAIATDRFGNDGPFAQLTIAVVSNQPPVVLLTRVSPSSGPLTNGQPFSIAVSATDDVSVSNVTVVGIGPFAFVTNFASGTSNLLSFVVPSNAAPGAIFQFRAQATDTLGLASAEAVMDLPVVDSLPPQLTILSPAANAVVNPAQPLALIVASLDNNDSYTIEVVLGGPLTATQTVQVVSAANRSVTNTFNFPLTGVETDGATITATVRATDAATNTATVVRLFTVPDTRPPRLLTTSPTNNAPRQSLWLAGAYFDFDERLNPASVTTNLVLVTNSVGAITPFTVFTTNNDQRVVVRLNRPLVPGAVYTNTLLPGLSDASSNAFVNADGLPIPAEGISSAFTTAAILGVTPTNGTRVIAGQTVPVSVTYEAGLGAGFFRFQFDTNAPVQTAAGATSAAAVVAIPTNATSASIAITASDTAAFAEPLALPSVALVVEPLSGDADGDGLPNGYEVANNLDPFRNDAGEDPDSDGLTNLQEFQRDTHPRLADTDGDGLNDGAEVALGTNPLNPDTDGDGLLDGVDPDPLQAFSGLVFTGTNQFDVIEGQTTNLVIQVSSTNGPILLLDYSPTNLPPPFVSLKSRGFVNTSSNGVGTIELELNPLHDAAGTHTFSLRATSAAGESGTFNLTLVVADNPALGVTRWKDPVSGNWNDTNRWDNGLPDAGKVAVIDVAGSYTVNLNTSVTTAGMVLNHSNAVLQTTINPTLNAPIEIRAGRFAINSSATITLNRPLANRATLRWISGNNTFTLQGTGRVENAGLWEVYQDAGCPACNTESWVQVPVNVPAGGKLLVSTNADLLLLGGVANLTVGGELEIQSGARLRLGNSSPAIELTLLAGSTLSGTGTIAVDGSNRVVVPGDFDSTILLQLNSTARLVAPGTYYVRTSRTMSGTLQVGAVVIATNATLTASSTAFPVPVSVEDGGRLRLVGGTVTFGTNVVIAPQARLDVDVGTTVNLNGVLTNLGTLRWISGNNTFTLQGSGRVENAGLWEVYQDAGCPTCASESWVQVPVNVPAGGKLLISTNADLLLLGGVANLTVGGELEIQEGARLRLGNSSPAIELTLLAGSTLSGTGTIAVDGSNRVVVPGDFDSTVFLQLNSSARLVAPGTYYVRTSRTMSGTLQVGAVVIATNATLTASSTSFPVPVSVEDGGRLRLVGGTVTFGTNVVIAPQARLDVDVGTTVNLNGVLTNLGTLRWISGNNTFTLQGTGRVENAGLWEVYQDASCPTCASESWVQVPVHVPAGGKLLISTNADLLLLGGVANLTVGGELEIQEGARLRLGSSSPAIELTLLAGSTLSGTGTIAVDGSNRVVVPGDFDSTVFLQLNSSARLVAPGTYYVRTSRTMSGTLQVGAVVIATNATLTASSTSFPVPVSVEDGGRLRLVGGTVSFGSNVVVAAAGRLDVDVGTTVNLSGVLTNLGTLRWISGNNTFTLQGSGRVENAGLWEVYQDAGCPACNTESWVQVPVNVPAGGKLLVSTNADLLLLGGLANLTVGGELEIQEGARLRLGNSSPAIELTLLAGSSLVGTGTLLVDGSNRVVAPGDFDSTILLQLNSSAQLIAPGTYYVRSSRTMSGTLQVGAVVIATNATLTASSTSFPVPVSVEDGGRLRLVGGTVTFGTNVVIAPQARLDVDVGTTVNLSGVLTNLGTLRWISGNNTFTLQGTGRVENAGLWEVYQDAGCPTCASESWVQVPVNVPAGGKLLISTNADLLLLGGVANLTVGGELEIQEGARLRLGNSSPAIELTLLAGSVNSGSGTLQLDGANRLILSSDTVLNLGLVDFLSSSSLATSNTVTIAAGATVRFDHSSTINGPVVVNGTLTLNNATATLRINDTLTLNASGVLNNSGTISVAVFVDNGGTIIGNAPVITGPAPGLRISEIKPDEPGTTGLRSADGLFAGREVVLVCRGAPGLQFVVETSVNLKDWVERPAMVTETAPGRYEARVTTEPGAQWFFRLRVITQP